MAAWSPSVGDVLEVAGQAGSEYAHSFSLARVKRITPGETLVEYCEFIMDNGQPLAEAFRPAEAFQRLRPQLPENLHRPELTQYKVGDTCDVYYEDVWWCGIVTLESDDQLEVTRLAHDSLPVPVLLSTSIRPGYEWEANSWRRRVPSQSSLVKLRLPLTGELEELIKALKDESPLMIDGTPMNSLQSTYVPRAPAQVMSASRQQLGRQAPQQQQRQLPQQVVPAAAAAAAQAPEYDQDLAAQTAAAAVAAAAAAAVAAAQAPAAAAPPSSTPPLQLPNLPLQLGNLAGGLGGLAGLGGLTQAAAGGQANNPLNSALGALLNGGMMSAQRLPGISNLPLGNLAVLQQLQQMQAAQQGRMGGLPGLPGAGLNAAAGAAAAFARAQQQQQQGNAQRVGVLGTPSQYAARLAHNESVRSETAFRDSVRALYLKQHLDKLRPFINPMVAAQIEQRAARAPADYQLPEPVQEQPSCIKGEMREYQVAGLQWLVRQYDNGINAILADEMGLGKTLQTIAFLSYLTLERKVTGPHLVVVPLSVLPNWMSEFKRFAPDMRVVRIHVNDEGERQRLRRDVLSCPSSFDVGLTTYEMINSLHFGDALKHTIMWRYLVLDEGHRVKNEGALISQGMRQVSRQGVLMLTGTPVQNNLHELFALLNFMFPDVFVSSEPFDRAFNLQHGQVDQAALEAAHKLLRPFMLRRVKDEVECRLPPKLETRINCHLSECQTFWYRRLLMRDCELLRAAESSTAQGGSGGAWSKMMNLLMQLRKVCNHPYLFSVDTEPAFDGMTTGEDIVEVSGKMQVLDRMLVKLKERGHRVVLFSQFARMLDIMEDYLRMRGWKYKRLDGQTNRIQRMIDIQQFNKPNSELFIYILCTRAGGLGVNLQTADTCILFDSDWNPQQDLQAMARVHRIGQTKPVHVYRLVSEGTVEERIQKRAESKLFLDKMVNRNSTQAAEEYEKLDKGEVLNMLKFGADRIFKNDSGREPTDQELDAIIDRKALQDQFDREQQDEPQQKDQKDEQQQAIKQEPQPVKQEPAAQPVGVLAQQQGGINPILLAQQQQQTQLFQQQLQVAMKQGLPPAAAATLLQQHLQQQQQQLQQHQAASSSMFAAQQQQQQQLNGIMASGQHSAAEFQAEEPSLSTFNWAGVDYKEIRHQVQNSSLKELSAQFWANRKRQHKERVIKVDGHDVLKEDNYTMAQGGISVAVPAKGRGRSRRQLPGQDYPHCDYCQHCWDGGELLCCDFCPVSMHPNCLGLSMEEVSALKKWSCPHHTCATCGRTTAAAGGLLFRCELCEAAYCEDHLPEGYDITGECDHFKGLGQTHPKQACFILCSDHCKKNKVDLKPILDELANRIYTKEHQAAGWREGYQRTRNRKAPAAATPGDTSQEGGGAGSGAGQEAPFPPPDVGGDEDEDGLEEDGAGGSLTGRKRGRSIDSGGGSSAALNMYGASGRGRASNGMHGGYDEDFEAAPAQPQDVPSDGIPESEEEESESESDSDFDVDDEFDDDMPSRKKGRGRGGKGRGGGRGGRGGRGRGRGKAGPSVQYPNACLPPAVHRPHVPGSAQAAAPPGAYRPPQFGAPPQFGPGGANLFIYRS